MYRIERIVRECSNVEVYGGPTNHVKALSCENIVHIQGLVAWELLQRLHKIADNSLHCREVVPIETIK
jgi:hypothetical protein